MSGNNILFVVLQLVRNRIRCRSDETCRFRGSQEVKQKVIMHMDLTSNMVINIYSILLLTIILVHNLKHSEKKSFGSKLFMLILHVTVLMLFMDIFSRFDGKPDTFYPVVNYLGNFFIYLMSLILPSLWLMYAHYQVYRDEEKSMRLLYPLLFINGGNAVIVVLSQLYGWYYSIDTNNIYHRGPLFWLPVSITILILIAAFILIYSNRKNIESTYYHSLLFFALPPFLGVILQSFVYGISLMLNSVVLSLLITFFNIQNGGLYTDYLTGIYNRKRLETYMSEKISASSETRTFSAILLDLDNFKSINDSFGHDVGDDALAVSAKLLNSCLRTNDFIARFGGDEFYIILNISDFHALESAVSRINTCVEKYNQSSTKPYKLGFSMGYAVYDHQSNMKLEDFQKQIDMMMYRNKRAKKSCRTAGNKIYLQ